MKRIVLGFSAIFLAVALISCCKIESEETITNNLDWNKQIAVAYVHSYAHLLAQTLPMLETDSSKIDFVQKAIEDIRFYPDSSGYFYVYNLNCVNIAHARQKDIVGSDLTNYQDSKGKFVIQELSKLAQNGGGYLDFYWIKPGSEDQKEKLGYVEPITGTDWFIGSGVYIE